MSATPSLALVAHCRTLCRPRSQAPDGELLARFARRRDAAAFEELLERYAPLVWGVCRRVAPGEADAEDAFQAAFLALVRHAGRLEECRSLGAWLYTVAVHAARKARSRTLRQNTRANLPESAGPGDAAEEAGSRELLRTVDEEVERLPARLRAPVILCCLEGRTRDEVAEALGCSVAALKGRLERGRRLLRGRLARRGIELPAAFLVLSLTGGRVRASLWARTVHSALQAPPPAVAALADAGLRAFTAGKLKPALVVLAILLLGAAGICGRVLTAEPTQPPAEAAPEPKAPEAPQVRVDRHGDPLPDGAVARLGTVRWRHGTMIFTLAYSPDGKKIAAVGGARDITLWDAATGKQLCQLPKPHQTDGLAFSPDGKVIAATDTPDCYLWDAATGKEVGRLKGHPKRVHALAFSPDGKQVATGGDDGTVRLWDPATGKGQRRIECGFGEACRLAYSPDGKWIASTAPDGTIHLWDPASGKEARRLSGHTKVVWELAFSPDGGRLTTVGADETVRRWDVAAGRQSRILDLARDLGRAWPIALSRDGALLALRRGNDTTGLWDVTVIWDVEAGTETHRWQTGELFVRSGAEAFSPDGKTLASGTIWGVIRLQDAATGRDHHPSEDPQGLIDLVRFSSNGPGIVSLSSDHRLQWWDSAAQTPRRQFTWPAQRRTRAAVSPDGETLAVGDGPDFKANLWELRLWDVRAGKPGRSLGKHKGMSWNIAFSPDGRLVACGDNDRLVHIWDASNGKEVRQIKDVPSGEMSLCFSPDSTALACGIGGQDRDEPALHLWDVASGTERVRFDVRIQHSNYGTRLAFSPDGRVLAFAAEGRNTCPVRLWDAASGKELSRYAGHSQSVGALAFSPDGKLVASGSAFLFRKDDSVHVWEAATGRPVRRFDGHQSNYVGGVDFSPDGLTVASGAADTTILLWDVTGRRPDGRWHAKPLTPRQLDACWAALADEDAAKAYDAVWALVAAPEQAAPFLQKRLPPLPRPDAKIVARLIADMDSDDFTVRQKAAEELGKLGDTITSALRQALEGKPSEEMRRRARQLLDQAREWTAERLRDHRAIQVLAHIGTRPAKEVLRAIAGGAPDAHRTEEAKAAVPRVDR